MNPDTRQSIATGSATASGRRRSSASRSASEVRTPAAAAGDSEAQALGEQLADQPGAAGAEGQPYGDLALPRRRPRQQQVAEIGAGDQQHQRRGAEQDEQRIGEVAERRRARRRRLRHQPLIEHVPARRLVGDPAVVAGQPLLKDDVGVGLCRARRHAVAQPAERVQPHHLLQAPRPVVQPGAAGQDGALHRQRHPRVRLLADRLAGEPARRDADHLDAPSRNARVAPIASDRPPKRRCQKSWLRTACGAAPWAGSWLPAKTRPTPAGTFSASK